MARLAGSKNKKKLDQFESKPIFDSDDEKVIVKKRMIRPIEEDLDEESSINSGDLKDRTVGYQPRSRMGHTRNMSFRTEEEAVQAYQRINKAQHMGHTYLPERLLNDPDYVYQWCREKIKDRDENNNIWKLESLGLWEAVDADICPELAFYSTSGDIQDSATRIRDGGLILMRRYRAVHMIDQEHRKIARSQQNRIQNIIRTVNTELHPFATGGVDHGQAFFPIDPQAAQFSGVFGQ